jgi:hypothetical protein
VHARKGRRNGYGHTLGPAALGVEDAAGTFNFIFADFAGAAPALVGARARAVQAKDFSHVIIELLAGG